MIIVMKEMASEDKIQSVLQKVHDLGYKTSVIRGVNRTVIAAVGDERGKFMLQQMETLSGVDRVVPVLDPYKLASRTSQIENSVIHVNGASVGDGWLTVIAGPCSVESYDQMMESARIVKEHGGKILRGGAFKPRTSPYSFQGLEEEGLKYLAEAGKAYGLPVVTEVVNPRDAELVVQYADILQVGARNTQNYALLKELGQAGKPVLLKRGMSSTIEELLMSAEYILSEGNSQVILCERGIRTFERATRSTLDLSAVPVLKEKTHLPVIVDPSHATGNWKYVPAMAKAAVVAGADGIMVEMHPRPEEALCDGEQSLRPKSFQGLMEEIRQLCVLMEKRM
ncbi:MAG: 3-deoxy-7-phosphoheptulonate synthase [Deltaproteobacteria bacterium]|nr:3-deoxy-7-phosphoheptulonate synthase [Deltaproteobacteria bacterium]